MKVALIWWHMLTKEQQDFIHQNTRPHWTFEMFCASTSTIELCFSSTVWDHVKGWPERK
jgi:hypothetical protein